MDFLRFGIDERLAAAAARLRSNAMFHERMLAHAVAKRENICARLDLSEGREAVCLLPALQWLAAEAVTGAGGPRVLAVAPDRDAVDRMVAVAAELGAAIGATVCRAAIVEGGEELELEGEPSSAVAAGTPEALIEAGERGLLQLRQYGFLVMDGAERLAELPSEILRRFGGALLPSWERRTLLACSKITAKAKNLAWDFADNPSEIHIEEDVVKAQSVAKETWYVAADQKMRFLLGLLDRAGTARACVFCNLRGTAEEVAARLGANGRHCECLSGTLPDDHARAAFDRVVSSRDRTLVLTDEGAAGLPRGSFALVVNYDIPLEPELFVTRLEMLDRAAPGAKAASLACDRYVYGLPAIEQFIDVALEPKQADESLLAAADKSAGMAYDRQRRHGRQGEAPGRDRGPRGSVAQRAPDGRGREAQHGDDRRPEIRRSIAEATGGSLDMDGAGRARGPSGRPVRSGEGRGPGDGRKGGGQRRDREPGGRREKQAPRPAASREGVGRGDARRSPEGWKAGNPYELPMEERMRRYREKYGRKLGDRRSDEPRGARPAAGGAEGRGQGRKRGPGPEGPGGRPPRSGRDQAQRREAPEPPRNAEGGANETSEGGDGIVSRLFGLFRKNEK